MRCAECLILAGVLIAQAGQPAAGAPALSAVETFAGKTPREYSPAYVKAPEADRAFAVIDAALKRAWELPDPRDSLAELIGLAAEVDPVRACDRVREVGVRLQKMPLPPARRAVWSSFARAVAAQDRDLRDGLLRVAGADARRALDDAGLWKPDPVPPGAGPRDDPQRLRDFEKQLLAYQVRLWEAVREQRADRPKAVRLATALLADAKAKGECPLGCIVRTYEHAVADDLADLDADLYLATVTGAWDKKSVAESCARHAYARWVDRQRDAFTGTFATYAVEHGVVRGDVVRIFGHYDLAKAWKAVADLPDDSQTSDFPRLGPMLRLVEMWAWRDPDAALAAAEQEPGASARRDLVEVVARVWAQKKPDQIEQAIQKQDNAVRQSWARDQAAAELDWRKKGNPPRDTPATAPRRFVVKGLKTPAGTPWTPPADVQALLADPSRAAEADKKLLEMAPGMGQYAPADHAAECVGRIRSPHMAVRAAVWVARGLIRRAETE